MSGEQSTPDMSSNGHITNVPTQNVKPSINSGSNSASNSNTLESTSNSGSGSNSSKSSTSLTKTTSEEQEPIRRDSAVSYASIDSSKQYNNLPVLPSSVTPTEQSCGESVAASQIQHNTHSQAMTEPKNLEKEEREQIFSAADTLALIRSGGLINSNTQIQDGNTQKDSDVVMEGSQINGNSSLPSLPTQRRQSGTDRTSISTINAAAFLSQLRGSTNSTAQDSVLPVTSINHRISLPTMSSNTNTNNTQISTSTQPQQQRKRDFSEFSSKTSIANKQNNNSAKINTNINGSTNGIASANANPNTNILINGGINLNGLPTLVPKDPIPLNITSSMTSILGQISDLPTLKNSDVSSQSNGPTLLKQNQTQLSGTSNYSKGVRDCSKNYELTMMESIEHGMIYEIACGGHLGKLYQRKFVCPGINSRCIQMVNDEWCTPKEFVARGGKESLKDWKRAIKVAVNMFPTLSITSM